MRVIKRRVTRQKTCKDIIGDMKLFGTVELQVQVINYF